ncbi:F-box/kelch-repeat protein At3g06240-like [Silene latifolia]|uniref:F-box/kelch-repeat protein At3g06240-like n=1 Tax=Silene latifolia TaxID=37657 RepID=UPI003D77ABFB
MTWRDDSLSYGFGYDSEHDDYKIVVTSRVWTEIDRDVRIYSLNGDSWSYPTPPPTRVSSGRRWENGRWQNAIFKYKMLHYLVSDVGDHRIARFDVVTEKWRDDLSLPQVNNPVQLGELDGLLYLRGGSYSSEVWIMEEHGSWKKMFHLPTKFDRHQLIALSKDGRDRLLLQYLEYCGDLKWYDHQANKTVPFTLKVPARYSVVMLCIASLVTIPRCSSEKLHDIKEKRAKLRLLGCVGLSS